MNSPQSNEVRLRGLMRAQPAKAGFVFLRRIHSLQIAMFLKSKAAPKTPEKIEKRRRFWRRARRRLFWTLAVLFVAHSGLNIYASVLLNRELAAIRQKGEPLQFAELEPPAVPDAQNAALVYKEATASLHISSQEEIAFDTRASQRTPQMKRDFEAALRKNQKTLDLTRRAAAMPQCRFPLDWNGDPTRVDFPYYAELRELAGLLAAQARLEAQNGNTDAALRDVRALFGMAHHLSGEPYVIGFLVAQAIDAVAHRTLAQVLESAPLTVSQARAFQNSLPADDWNRIFHRTLVGERTISLFAFESLRQPAPENFADESVPFWAAYPLLLLWRPVLKLDEVQSLRLWSQLLDAPLYQQVPRPVGSAQSLDAAIENAPRYAVLTRTLFPVFSRAGNSRDAMEVRRRQREIALALALYRTARGRYPAQLQEVVALWGKPLPLDIYNGKPFLYRREGESFTLYSVGVNRRDDGGKHQSSVHLNPNADDLLWRNSRN